MNEDNDTTNDSRPEDTDPKDEFPNLVEKIHDHPEIRRNDREEIHAYLKRREQSVSSRKMEGDVIILKGLAIFSRTPLVNLDRAHAKQLVQSYSREKGLSYRRQKEYWRTLKLFRQSVANSRVIQIVYRTGLRLSEVDHLRQSHRISDEVEEAVKDWEDWVEKWNSEEKL